MRDVETRLFESSTEAPDGWEKQRQELGKDRRLEMAPFERLPCFVVSGLNRR